MGMTLFAFSGIDEISPFLLFETETSFVSKFLSNHLRLQCLSFMLFFMNQISSNIVNLKRKIVTILIFFGISRVKSAQILGKCPLRRDILFT
jgi:hypothetical protein